MAKKAGESVIALEIKKYEDKIAEFQNYLISHKINEELMLDENKYKEMDIQMKMMSALPAWLLSLKTLKEDSESESVELRGGSEINDAARLMMNRNK